MPRLQQSALPRILRFVGALLACLLLPPLPVSCQDSAAEGTIPRGDRLEISVTVRDSSGEPISAPATVKLYHEGVPADQGATSHGRAFFITRSLGNYTLVVEATGYKAAQKDVSLPVALKAEVDVYLQRERSGNETVGVPGKPVLAPKAKEAFDKGLQAINGNKLPEAQKYVGQALKLAPGHPDVLFLQGVLDLSQHHWPEAQTDLEKATQLDPNNARAFAALGMAFTNQGKYEAAIPPLEKSLQLQPTGWETQWTLAKAYYHQQQYDQALKTSQQALAESNGKAPDIALLVAQSLTAVGQYDAAANVLRDFLKTHGDRPQAPTARRWLEGLAKSGKIKSD
jgi:tetratricopeptide (TPR) repeat protein